MAGIGHDAAVDVWGLGRLSLELLALTDSSSEGHPLHSLATDMVKDEPDERPSIEAVCVSIASIFKAL